MGIIIHDSIEDCYGGTHVDTYGTIMTGRILISKNVIDVPTDPPTAATYRIQAVGKVYVSKAARDTGSRELMTLSIIIPDATELDITSNVIDTLYTKFKENYTSATDEL